MSFVRNLLADLVAKRLWPVAALLLVALIAAPLALVKTSADAPVATTSTPVPPAGAQDQAAVTPVAEQARGGRPPIGRNPFVQPRTATSSGGTASAATPATVGATASAGVGTSSSGGSSVPAAVPSSGGSSFGDVASPSLPGLDSVDVVPVGGGSGGGSSSSGTSPKPSTADNASWHVDLRFGEDGKSTRRDDVPRLSPLPSAADPFFVFLGVLADGKTALFLVSSDAEATGDGKCLPSTQTCERVQMQAGDTEFFDVTAPDGTVKQYQLDLVRVQRRTSATTATAAAARTRESSQGREVLRTAVRTGQVEVDDLVFSRDLGLVVPSGKQTEQGQSLFGGFRVDLRFGAAGALVKRYNLARLTPLPSVDEPSLVFLGVLADGKTAIFLNPTEAAASGDAVCLPSPEECQRVTIGAGQKAAFSAPTIDGETRQYELQVDDVAKVRVDTPEEAAASITRESPAGRVILRRLITEVGSLVGDLSFSTRSGAIEEQGAAGAK